MFTSQGELAAAIFSALTFLVAIPTAIKVFNWIATLYKGSIAFNTPMLYTLSFLFLFTIGGLTGLPLATLATDMHLHDSYFVVAHFHYVMIGGTVIAMLGGLHHWWPKMFGKMYNEPRPARLLARLHRLQPHVLHPVLHGHAGHAPAVRQLRRRVPDSCTRSPPSARGARSRLPVHLLTSSTRSSPAQGQGATHGAA
jgi:hypothetical protein